MKSIKAHIFGLYIIFFILLALLLRYCFSWGDGPPLSNQEYIDLLFKPVDEALERNDHNQAAVLLDSIMLALDINVVNNISGENGSDNERKLRYMILNEYEELKDRIFEPERAQRLKLLDERKLDLAEEKDSISREHCLESVFTEKLKNRSSIRLKFCESVGIDYKVRMFIDYVGLVPGNIVRFAFKSDSNLYEIPSNEGYYFINKMNPGHHYEQLINDDLLVMMRDISSSNEAKLKYIGMTRSESRIITTPEKKGIKQILDFYDFAVWAYSYSEPYVVLKPKNK